MCPGSPGEELCDYDAPFIYGYFRISRPREGKGEAINISFSIYIIYLTLTTTL